MSLIKKYNIIVISTIICTYGIIFAMFKTNNKSLFISVSLLLLIFYFILIKFLWKFLYIQYLNILDKKLDPEKFLQITDVEYKSVNKKETKQNFLYKNYLKLNYASGYLCLNKENEALEILEKIKIEDEKIPEILKFFYYYNKSLVLYELHKNEEAKKMYEKVLDIKNNNKNILKKLNEEIIGYLEILEYLIYDGNNLEILLQLYENFLYKIKNKRVIIGVKYSIAEIKEKQGKIEEAKQLYKEVVEKGNKLYIVELAKKKLLELK